LQEFFSGSITAPVEKYKTQGMGFFGAKRQGPGSAQGPAVQRLCVITVFAVNAANLALKVIMDIFYQNHVCVSTPIFSVVKRIKNFCKLDIFHRGRG
jgi:hypothetical protein